MTDWGEATGVAALRTRRGTLDGRSAAVAARRVAARDSTLRRLLATSDAIAIAVALSVALALPSPASVTHELLWGLASLPVMVLIFKVYGLYDRDVKRISHSTVDDLPWLFHATVMGGLVIWLYSKISPLHQLDLIQVVAFGVLTIVLVTFGRFAVRTGCARLLGPEAALLIGSGSMAKVLVSKLAAHPEYRSKVVGLLAFDHEPDSGWNGLPILGSPEQLATIAAQHRAGRVIVSPGNMDERELEGVLRRCRALSLKVSVLPQLSDVLGPAVEIDDVEGIAVLGVNPPWLSRSSRALKRTLDIAVAIVLLVVLSPVLALIAALIRLDSRGPIFFTQQRVGKGGRHFRLFKFRTMVPDAEQRRAALLAQSKDPNWLHIEHDPRITRLGHHVRRLSLDELPQLWNVLRGEMSMVGPRPLIEAENDRVEEWARGRLDLTPGITGYWQVLGRTRIPFEEMVKLDYLYVMNWSLWTDLRLIMRTLPTVIGGRGAN